MVHVSCVLCACFGCGSHVSAFVCAIKCYVYICSAPRLPTPVDWVLHVGRIEDGWMLHARSKGPQESVCTLFFPTLRCSVVLPSCSIECRASDVSRFTVFRCNVRETCRLSVLHVQVVNDLLWKFDWVTARSPLRLSLTLRAHTMFAPISKTSMPTVNMIVLLQLSGFAGAPRPLWRGLHDVVEETHLVRSSSDFRTFDDGVRFDLGD